MILYICRVCVLHTNFFPLQPSGERVCLVKFETSDVAGLNPGMKAHFVLCDGMPNDGTARKTRNIKKLF